MLLLTCWRYMENLLSIGSYLLILFSISWFICAFTSFIWKTEQKTKRNRAFFLCLLQELNALQARLTTQLQGNITSSIFKIEKKEEKKTTQWVIQYLPGRDYVFLFPVLCLYDKAEAWSLFWKLSKVVHVYRRRM